MSLFRRLFAKRPPAGLVEISSNILVFDHCFSMDLFEEDELMPYISGILKQLLGSYSIDSFMVFNFEGCKDNQVANIFSYYDMSVMGYPRNYEGCPLLTMEMIHHFLRSSESWLSLSQDNFLLIHAEHGGWPILAFALAALLVYLRRYKDERKGLEMVCRQAPKGLAELFSPLDPVPSQLRYLKKVPNFDGQGGCRPLFRFYGPDPLAPNDRSAKVLFSTPKTSDFVQHYTQEDCEIVKVNVQCPVQGDVVMECISMDEDFKHEVMMFRTMFSTAFIEDNLLLLDRDQIDILWDTKHRFPVDFRVEAIFSDMDMTTLICTYDFKGGDASTHVTNGVSEQKGIQNEHEDFNMITLDETKTTSITAEHRQADNRSVQVHHIELEDEHSSTPKFERASDHVSSALSLPEPHAPGPNPQEDQLFKNTSTFEEQNTHNTNSKPNLETQSKNLRDAEASDAAITEWSDTNKDVYLSDAPASNAPSSLPKFDKDTLEAGMVESQSERRELQL
ncbi:hypothetical protein ACP70R_042415 [Stipagrostis hirtigluma subsp. patula]